MGEDPAEGEHCETERKLSASTFFMHIPLLFSFIGCVSLVLMPELLSVFSLPIYFFPIDRFVVAVFGPDSAWMSVYISLTIGVVLGLLLSLFMVELLDIVRQDREVELSLRSSVLFFGRYVFVPLSILTVIFIDAALKLFTLSVIFPVLCLYLLIGYFLGFSLPILLEYTRLVLHSTSNEERVIMVVLYGGSGLKRRLQRMIIGMIDDGPDP